MHSTNQLKYPDAVSAIAREAGGLLMRYFTGSYELRHKGDKSPVTNADIEANALITTALKKLDPAIPVIAEEDEELSAAAERFWLVDPLDGTRAFVAGEPEFTVNIGLIENHQPVFGVLYSPAQDLLYYGGFGQGAYRIRTNGAPEKIRVRPKPKGGLIVTRSKSHPSQKTNAFLETLNIEKIIAGSSAIKFGQVADGTADIYPRFGRTMEWDTAAGHAILNEAGGRVVTESGDVLTYGKPHFENPGFIAYGYSAA